MIYSVTGQVAAVGPDYIVVENGGVGYQIFVPQVLLFKRQTGTDIKLYTYHHIREDISALYGFDKETDLKLFNRLISVSGVGPKAGLSILSQVTADSLRRAIDKGEVAVLAQVPGIGKKTAERVTLELSGKLGQTGQIDDQVEQALNGLGFSKQEARKALQDIDNNLPTDQKLKQALTKLRK